MKKGYELLIEKSTVDVFAREYQQGASKTNKRFALTLLTTIALIAGYIWYLVRFDKDSGFMMVVLVLGGLVVNFIAYMKTVKFTDLKSRIDRLFVYQKMFRNAPLSSGEIGTLIQMESPPVLIETSKTTVAERIENKRRTAEVELRNLKKKEAFREYDTYGIASMMDLVRVSSRDMRFLMEDFTFFLEKGMILNLKIDPNDGYFIIGGEKMQRWGDRTSKGSVGDSENSEPTETSCSKCGATRENLAQIACDYCGTAFKS